MFVRMQPRIKRDDRGGRGCPGVQTPSEIMQNYMVLRYRNFFTYDKCICVRMCPITGHISRWDIFMKLYRDVCYYHLEGRSGVEKKLGHPSNSLPGECGARKIHCRTIWTFSDHYERVWPVKHSECCAYMGNSTELFTFGIQKYFFNYEGIIFLLHTFSTFSRLHFANKSFLHSLRNAEQRRNPQQKSL